MANTRRRVKLYTLNEERQWDDRGTGHVSSSFVERLQGMSIMVRSEEDGLYRAFDPIVTVADSSEVVLTA